VIGKGTTLDNPFTPDPGELPDVFEGREEEINEFKELIRDVGKKTPRPTLRVLYAPRGHGKTTLLRYLKEHSSQFAREENVKDVQTIILTPSELNLKTLYRKITGNNLEVETSVTKQGSGGIDAGTKSELLGFQLAFKASGNLSKKTTYEHDVEDFAQVIELIGKYRPTILCIDESHTMDPQVLRNLLQCLQQTTGDKIPVTTILSGTPELRRAVRECNASFATRYTVHTLRTLTTEESRRAIGTPFTKNKVESPPEHVIDEMVRECHNYPFFIQLYGRALWRNCVEDESLVINAEKWEKATTQFHTGKDFMYEERYEEISKKNLLESAFHIAKLFDEKEQWLESELVTRLSGEGISDSKSDIQQLSDLGYLWKPDVSKRFYERAILSLMDHIKRNVQDDLKASAHRQKLMKQQNKDVPDAGECLPGDESYTRVR